MYTFILALLIFQAHAEPQDQIDPIEPAFAADQPQVGFDSMYREMSQFSNFANWNALKAELGTKRLECEEKEKTLERAKRLGKKVISEQEMDKKIYDVEICNLNSELIAKSIDNSKASAAYDKFMIVQTGNPGTDFRSELAEALKRQIQFEVDQLKINERIAEVTRVYRKARLDRALALCEKKVIKMTECDSVRIDYESALNRQRALIAQSKINARSLEGLKRSIDRLNAGSGGPAHQ